MEVNASRKIVLLLVCVNLSLVLILATSTREAKATSLPNNHKSNVKTVQSSPLRSSVLQVCLHTTVDGELIGIRPDPIMVAFTHNLSSDPDTYHVILECRTTHSLGTYDCKDNNLYVRHTGMV